MFKEPTMPSGDDNPEGDPELEKLTSEATYEELEERIPEVAAMRGFDQRSEFHSLNLDDHTKELVRHLEMDPVITALPDKERNLVLLAGKMHDLGKTSEDGQQVHPRDPERRQYSGHEDESARMVREILAEHFELEEDEVELVARLAGLHASALNLVNNFETNNEPKGKDLKAYDKFVAQVEEIPGDLDLETKMRIVFAFNKSDKMAGFNQGSNALDPSVARIIENAEKQVGTLEEMEKALPALMQAIHARRGGDQKAGIVFEGGEYKYKKQEKAEVPPALRKLGGILRDKLLGVVEIYPKLKATKDNKGAFQGIVKGVLRGKLELSDDQVEAVIKSLDE
jgi:hypothetical protein